MKGSHNSFVSGSLYQILVGVMILIYALASGNWYIELSLHNLILIGMSVGLFTVSASLWYYSIQRIPVSTTTIVLSTRSIFALLLGFVLLGETVTFRQLGGMGLILAGVIYSQYSNRLTTNIYYLLILLANALIASTANIVDRLATKSMNLYMYLMFAFIFPGMIMMIFQRIKHKQIHLNITKGYLYHILTVSILIFFGSLFYLIGLSKAPSTGMAVFVNQTRVVLTVILAALFLHERSHLKQKVVSSFLCLGGLYLLN
jgi:drug/metabolite transporter (DMT)-like permease